MSCNRDCAFGGECTCRPAPPHIHAVDTLVDGKLTRSIITPEWRERMLSEPEEQASLTVTPITPSSPEYTGAVCRMLGFDGPVMARWPGGIGERF